MSKLLRYDKATKVALRKVAARRTYIDEQKFEVVRFGKRYGEVEVLAIERKYEWAVESFYEWVKRFS